MANVKVFKLVTGEELLATIVLKQDQQYYILKDIVKIGYHETDKGMAFGFLPFLPVGDFSEIELKESSLVCYPVKPKADVEAEYSRIFSGIVLPQSQGLVLPS